MANSCSVANLDVKAYPLSGGMNWPLPINREIYSSELVNALFEQLQTMATQLEDFNPAILVPASSGITYVYPDIDDFVLTKPPPLVIDINVPFNVERPPFIEIEKPPPVDIPPWTLGEVVLDLPNLPDPSIPELTTDAPVITYPVMPDPLEELVAPDLPVLNPISLPSFAEVEFPYFTDTLEAMEINEPSIFVSPGNNDYQSDLNDLTKQALYDGVRFGGTGLAPEVEQDIFLRESERSLQAHNDRLIKLRADWLKGHFPLPTSMFYAMINEAETDYTNKRLDISRDISIEQAKLAQTNTHFFIEKSLAYEQTMINWFNSIAQRNYEASKYTMDASLELFKASIQKYNILVDVFKAKVNFYDVQANVAIKRLEAFKIKLEAQKTTAEINRINVEVYKAQIDALNLFINQYRAELEGAKTYLEVENLKLQGYKTGVEAYGIRVNAATAYYNMFNTRIEGEKAKVQAYAAGADAYGKRIQAVKAGIDAETAFINAEADINKSYASVYESDIKAFQGQVQAEVAEAEGNVKVYEGKIKAYETEAKVVDIVTNFGLKKIDTQLKEFEIEYRASLESVKLEVTQILDQWKQRFQVLETMAQVIAQVASAALNSDSFTTHMSESFSYGEQHQVSCTDQHYYDDTEV